MHFDERYHKVLPDLEWTDEDHDVGVFSLFSLRWSFKSLLLLLSCIFSWWSLFFSWITHTHTHTHTLAHADVCTVWWSVSSFSTLSNPSHDIWIRNISALGKKKAALDAGKQQKHQQHHTEPQHDPDGFLRRLQPPWMNATRFNLRVKEPQHPSKRTESWSIEGKPGPIGTETSCPTWKGANQPPTQATRRQRWLQRPIRSG